MHMLSRAHVASPLAEAVTFVLLASMCCFIVGIAGAQGMKAGRPPSSQFSLAAEANSAILKRSLSD